ncbi:Membrane-bound lytic murein transglycosylase A precursor [Limihaloglobus sulfuriphilus]|uniref:peptidoglycan lytic exotransglycosylase n=1 Tax=Limihaloglobus sulfuriphilus TaxID=1851148 RepID=A0A1Q2MHC1_9BACT|nr:MltA domain-containing protein [Limihaloglobus sulfuriphilus]AQQ72090.1 Membrane-bound lytic murein transglycosylase A precursor [Limihaloglobus sulfuriphilus]
MRKQIFLLALSAVLMVLYTGCKPPKPEEKDYNRPLLPGEDALVKITDPARIPDFTTACRNTYNLVDAIDRSLNYMAKPSSEQFFPMQDITHQDVVESLRAFRDIVTSGMSAEDMNREIRARFDVYQSVGCDSHGTVLFTGYYTPIFNGSLEQTERFKYPLYSMPEDLVKDDMGNILGRKTAGGGYEAYPDREQIDSSGMLAGQELIWMEDAFEVYIAHVQGSAKIRLPNGRLVTVGYAATNGHEYRSIARDLSNEGGIPLDKMSLKAMIDYFKANPDQVSRYVNRNPRYVFFRETEGNPTGSINEPVTYLRTIATDKTIFPRASVVFIDTNLPRLIGDYVDILPFKGFMLDQDTGGAIRAAGRCDIYLGEGESAGLVAGKTYEEGSMYYLILK